MFSFEAVIYFGYGAQDGFTMEHVQVLACCSEIVTWGLNRIGRV